LARAGAGENTPLRRHIEGVMTAALRAKSLVERILAFSRSGGGERVPVHVQSVVGEALDLLLPSLPRGVTLTRELTAGDAAVLSDPAQIHQVVMNLCTNATQAMDHDGVLSVSLDVANQMQGTLVATGELPAGQYVRLSVQDQGQGIREETIERIFDPFFTTKGMGAGTGLGLSLVHGIVTDLGGGIEVVSAPGAGTRFIIYIPWFGRVAATKELDAPLLRGDGERILLIDDETALVQSGEEIIASLGYEPVGFTSSVAALDAFRADPEGFDAILSDETMPEVSGAVFAAEVRKLRGDIPIVLMSGYVTPALTARARAAGVSEVLSKPLAKQDLARCLAAVLLRRRRNA
jgi:CheY-like chemotaxis protein